MKRISFFNWSLMLVVLVSGLVFTGCSDDDEDGFDYPMETLYGTWIGTGIYIDGTWIDPTSSWLYDDLEFSITFYEGGKYYGKGFFGTGSGTYTAEGNTITTYINGEMYLYYKVTSLTNNKAELTMYDGSGDSMKLRVTKKSSASSEIPSDEPKEEMTLTLDYTFAESGSMTRATGSEVYTDFYDKYIKTKQLTPTTYSLTFKNKETGTTAATINGLWDNKDGIRLPEGEYTVTGYSRPVEEKTTSYPSDTVYLSFSEDVKITKDMTNLTLTAQYDSWLLLFDKNNTSDIQLGYYSNFNKLKSISSNDSHYWIFMKTKNYNSSSNSTYYYSYKIIRTDGKNSIIETRYLPFEAGKYYYFNDMTNSFDIPAMESGN